MNSCQSSLVNCLQVTFVDTLRFENSLLRPVSSQTVSRIRQVHPGLRYSWLLFVIKSTLGLSWFVLACSISLYVSLMFEDPKHLLAVESSVVPPVPWVHVSIPTLNQSVSSPPLVQTTPFVTLGSDLHPYLRPTRPVLSTPLSHLPDCPFFRVGDSAPPWQFVSDTWSVASVVTSMSSFVRFFLEWSSVRSVINVTRMPF